MPYIMGLEGPRPSPFQAAGAQLLGFMPNPLALAAARSEGPDNCCWQCACSENVCCDLYSPASRAYAAVKRFAAKGGGSKALRGPFTPITARPLLAVGALLFGAWLAGSSSGQKFVRRVRGK